MTSSLPGAWSLIVDSWNAFIKHWSTTVRYTAWLLLVTTVQQSYLLFPDGSGRAIVGFIAFVVSGLIGVWVSIRMYQAILALEAGQSVSPKTTSTAMGLVIPLALLGIVQMLATVGGLILLILPGIYVGVRLAFSQMFLIEDGVKLQGTFMEKAQAAFRAIGSAISQSWEKTKGRFWPIFGRQLSAGLLFVILTMLIGTVTVTLITLVVGGQHQLDAIAQTAIGTFLFGLINTLVQIAFVAVIATFQVKLYNVVKRA